VSSAISGDDPVASSRASEISRLGEQSQRPIWLSSLVRDHRLLR
jgi:hypothetical protein